MIGIILSSIPTILKFGRIALVVVALWFVYDFVTDSIDKTKQIAELQQVVEEKNDIIRAMEVQTELNNAAIAIVREAEIAAEAVKTRYDALIKRIYTTKETDDGPIAPVLRDTINALDGL